MHLEVKEMWSEKDTWEIYWRIITAAAVLRYSPPLSLRQVYQIRIWFSTMERSLTKRLFYFFLLYTLSFWSYCTFKMVLILTGLEEPKTKKQTNKKTWPCLVTSLFFRPKDHTMWTWRCTSAALNIAPTKGGAQNQFDFQIWSYDGCQGQFSLRGLLSVITQTRPARILKGKPTERRRFLRLRSVCLLQSLLTVHHLLWISYKFWKKNKKKSKKK